jgi:hypothetical protein
MKDDDLKQELTVEMVEKIMDFELRKASDLKKIAPWLAADGMRPSKEQRLRLTEKFIK